MHAQGKTEEARADLARLAIIRKQREDAAKKRAEEQAGESVGRNLKAIPSLQHTVSLAFSFWLCLSILFRSMIYI